VLQVQENPKMKLKSLDIERTNTSPELLLRYKDVTVVNKVPYLMS